MTTPLSCLLATMLLPYVLAGVAGYHKSKQLGEIDNHEPRTQALELTAAGARAWAAQKNAWEALAVFAPAVLVAHFGGADPGLSSTLSLVFVTSRALHAIFYVADQPTLRSASFLVGWVSALWLFWLGATA